MSYIGYVPAAKPLTSADITDGIITGNDIASTFDLTGKTVTLPAGVGGKVLQVISTAKTDTFSTTTGSFIDVTGLSVSITPSSTSNKILIKTDIHFGTPGNLGYIYFKLVRASTDIYLGDAAGSRIRGFGGGMAADSATTMQLSNVFLDSPSTTSSTTYKIQVYNQNTGQTGYVNRSSTDTDNTSYLRTASSITVMEIAG